MSSTFRMNLNYSEYVTNTPIRAPTIYPMKIPQPVDTAERQTVFMSRHLLNRPIIFTKKRVKFNLDANEIFIIDDRSYYVENDLNKDVWWTAAEMNATRHSILIKAQILQIRKPLSSFQDCVREICNNYS